MSKVRFAPQHAVPMVPHLHNIFAKPQPIGVAVQKVRSNPWFFHVKVLLALKFEEGELKYFEVNYFDQRQSIRNLLTFLGFSKDVSRQQLDVLHGKFLKGSLHNLILQRSETTYGSCAMVTSILCCLPRCSSPVCN